MALPSLVCLFVDNRKVIGSRKGSPIYGEPFVFYTKVKIYLFLILKYGLPKNLG